MANKKTALKRRKAEALKELERKNAEMQLAIKRQNPSRPASLPQGLVKATQG